MIQNYVGCILSPCKSSFFCRASYATEAVLKCTEAKLHRLDQGPKTENTVTKEEALTMYKQMAVARRMENSISNLYKAKLIRGFCHLYPGEEAVAVGIKSRLGPKDTVITSYRCHVWTYVMGSSSLSVIAELLGRESGCSRGKGGSMHIYHDNFYGGNGIVGAQVPLGAGLAFKHKYTNDGGMCYAIYGDGASNQGQVFEAFNMAKLWNLPVVFLIENNLYGMGTSAARSSSNTNYYQRGDLIPGILVDGSDIVAMRSATDFINQLVKDGKGPILMEALTYRFYGHSMSDSDTTYRTRDEVKKMRDTADPLTIFKAKAVEAGLLTEEETKKILDDAKKEIDGAVAKVKTDKEIPLAELTYDIYSATLEGKVRKTVHDNYGEHKVRGVAINLK
ncbi:hypothetical protein Trydic_g18948 [Trypoxylus dichotomus]